MKALIIDDEKKAREVLHILVNENCPKITQIFEASSLLEGIEIIKKEQPRLVFLDIEMPEHSGLDIFNFVNKDDYEFEIIFTTAYSQYALQAFQLSAVDYLLKPVRPSSVKEAVDKVLSLMGNSQVSQRLEELRESLKSNGFKKIGLPYADGIKFVNFQDIVMLKADGMYTKVSTITQTILVSKPLRYFAELLENIKSFYRPHRSYIVNLAFIKEYVKKDGGYILMENDELVSISNDKKEEFLNIVSSI